MPRFRVLWAVAIAVATLSLGAASPPNANAETRVALVVGNSAYQNTTPLTNPLNDAKDMAAALKRAGFDVVEALDADKRRLDGALRSFTDKLNNADVALFFYAGHGLQVGSQNYLVPIDAKLERERDLEFEAMKLDFVLRQMEIDREGKTSIVILDACRDNPLSRNLARSMGTRSAGIGRGLAAASTGLGTFIAYSTQPGNVALDGDGRNSPFTTAMVKHIGTVGRNLPATMIEVRKDVVAATNGRQVPWDHSALTGDFYFLPNTTTASAPAGGGAVVSAPPGASGDVTALQARLAKLEADAKDRDAAAKSATANLADTLKLAELRTRLTNYEEMNKDLQRRLMDTRRQEMQTTDPNEKTRLSRSAMNLQMEWSRIGQNLKKTREDIAALEGTSPVTTASTATLPVASAATLPVTPKATTLNGAADFEVVDNVRLLGTEIRSFKAPSPVACREVCEKESQCVGFQHGRKIENMGICGLFSRVDERREDISWRSGIRLTETPTSKAN
jgi:uncharacterized caspase-like protein